MSFYQMSPSCPPDGSFPEAASAPKTLNFDKSPLASWNVQQTALHLLEGTDWLTEFGFLDENPSDELAKVGDTFSELEGQKIAEISVQDPQCDASCNCSDCALLEQVREDWEGAIIDSSAPLIDPLPPSLPSLESDQRSDSHAEASLSPKSENGHVGAEVQEEFQLSEKLNSSSDSVSGPHVGRERKGREAREERVLQEKKRKLKGSDSSVREDERERGGLQREQGSGSTTLALSAGLPFFQRDDSLAKRLAEVVGETYRPPPEPEVLSTTVQDCVRAKQRSLTSSGEKERGGSGAALPKHWVRESTIGKQLIAFAEAIATDDENRGRFLMKMLRDVANANGGPMERIAYYFMEGLWARSAGNGAANYLVYALAPPQQISACLTEINKQLPLMQFMATAAIGNFLEASEGEAHIHILDLGVWHGNHWPDFMRRLVGRPGPVPTLRITKLQLPPTSATVYKIPSIDYVEYKQTLFEAAAKCGVQLEYQALQMNIENLSAKSIHLKSEEALLVYGAMRFHTLSDGSIIRSSPRDAALRIIRKLEPKLFLLGEKQVDHNGPFFLRRFVDCLEYYYAVFEAIDHHMARGSRMRHMFERNLLGRDIVNVVACEGLERVARSELLDRWRDRMVEAGFVSKSAKSSLKKELCELTGRFHANWGVEENNGALFLCWNGTALMATSAWRVAC